MSARILIVDDHELIRHGLRIMLRKRPHWKICGEATNGHDAIRLFEQLRPDISIVDISMPGMSGLEATQKITRLDPNAKVVFFTMLESAGLSSSVRSVGARGVVVKSQASRRLIDAIECILNGGTFFNQEAEKRVSEPRSRKRILFVDDEPAIRLTLPHILSSRGFEVISAADVENAVAEIKARQFDALLSDLNIPVSNEGFEVISAMRRHQPRCVNFILTGYPGEASSALAIEHQVAHYFTKPVDIEALVSKMNEKIIAAHRA